MIPTKFAVITVAFIAFFGVDVSVAFADYSFTTIDDPRGVQGSFVAGINNTGQLVGTYVDSGNLYNGYTYSHSSFATVNDPSGRFNSAIGINNSGVIVGTYLENNLINQRGFIYANGTYTTLNDPLATTSTYASGINDHNDIVGSYINGPSYNSVQHGFIYSGGSYVTLNGTLGTTNIFAASINNSGLVVGTEFDQHDVASGFIYNNGTYSLIHDPLGTGIMGTYVYGVNNLDAIVGTYYDSSNVSHGFIYENGIYTTIDDPLGTKGTDVYGINDLGQIVGAYVDNANITHGFIANPPSVPEPSSLITSGTGLVCIISLLAQRKFRSLIHYNK